MTCIPDCPICGGFGWLHRDLPIDDPGFGKLVPCPNRPVDHGKMTGLKGSEFDLDWPDIHDRMNVKEAVFAIQKTLEKGYGWVYIHGSNGLAKTLLLQIAVAVSIRAKKEAAYTRMVDIIDNLREAYGEYSSGESERRIEHWSKAPVLCIDEFEKMRKTEYATERQFSLMDTRYQEALRGNSITIMASEVGPEKYEGYLCDRILDGRFMVVKLVGASARSEMR